jgi:hypothetical protein
MTIATTPTSQIVGSPRRDAMLARRWADWEDPVCLWIRDREPNLSPIARAVFAGVDGAAAMRSEHAAHVQSLLARGIPMSAIRRLSLDDPRATRAELDRRVTEYNNRRQRRSHHVAH